MELSGSTARRDVSWIYVPDSRLRAWLWVSVFHAAAGKELSGRTSRELSGFLLAWGMASGNTNGESVLVVGLRRYFGVLSERDGGL